jgi:hypothetical protein
MWSSLGRLKIQVKVKVEPSGLKHDTSSRPSLHDVQGTSKLVGETCSQEDMLAKGEVR